LIGKGEENTEKHINLNNNNGGYGGKEEEEERERESDFLKLVYFK
jgi:hypothetical protein